MGFGRFMIFKVNCHTIGDKFSAYPQQSIFGGEIETHN